MKSRAPPPFPERLEPDEYGQVASGGEVRPEVLVEAYQRGIFPWSGEDPVPWCAPDPRLVLEPRAFVASRSLRKLERLARYEIAFDRDFEAVMRACAETPRQGRVDTWITPNMIEAYCELEKMGIGHSVGVYAGDQLVGGLYGLSFGRAFFGESMFSLEPDCSKLALYNLCRSLAERDFHFIDCQAVTRHLMTLGATPIPLDRYLARLAVALRHSSFHGSWASWRVE